MTQKPNIVLHLIGWHDQGALGDDLLAMTVRKIFEDAGEGCDIDLTWHDAPEIADYILVGGGTLLGVDNIGILEILRDCGKPYSIFGTGFRRETRDIGPERRAALGELFEKADHVYVRGFLSQQFCAHAGVRVPEVICDPAIGFCPVREVFDDRRFHVAVSLRAMGKGDFGEPQYVDNRAMADIVSQCIVVLSARHPCTLHLINLAENIYDADRDALDGIRRAWEGLLPVISCDFDRDPAQAFSRVASMDFIVSQRLHPSIIGWASGVPHICIDYQNCKTEDFCSTLGISEFCLRSDEFSVSAYATALDRLERERDIVAFQASQSVAYWKEIQRQAAALILRTVMDNRSRS